ncbi:hypothetical protein N9954_09005 [Maribacter sp.]|nr:hypothetical protein [Maribacter sp.]
MKITFVLILSISIVSSLISCKNNSNEATEAKGSYSLKIDGEVQNITSASGFLDNKYNFNNNDQFAEGLSLKTSIALADNTGVFISFNNNDLNSENVVLGDYTTSFDAAFRADLFKFGEITVSSIKGYFSSLGTNTDAIKLSKCDTAGGKISGEFDAVLTNKENNETIHVVGAFEDLSLIVSL